MSTKDEIIAMAREATAPEWWDNEDGWHMGMDLQRFAGSVATAAATAEREACAKILQDRAMKCEAEAQRASDGGERDEAVSLRAMAWQLSVCCHEILGRGKP